jgi:hypothetical protein
MKELKDAYVQYHLDASESVADISTLEFLCRGLRNMLGVFVSAAPSCMDFDGHVAWRFFRASKVTRGVVIFHFFFK